MGSIVEVKGPGGKPAFRAFVHKRRVRDDATHDTKSEARAWITRVEAAIVEGRHPKQQAAQPADAGMTLAQVLDWFLKKRPRSSARALAMDEMRAKAIKADPVGSMPVDQITEEDAESWRDRRATMQTKNNKAEGATVTMSTVRRERELIRAAINLAVKKKKTQVRDGVNPFAELEILGGASGMRTRVFRGDERARFLAALTECGNPQMVLAGRLAIATGLRRGELAVLHWEDVDYDTARITVQRTYDRKKDAEGRVVHGWRKGTKTPKRGEIRVDEIPLTKAMRDILDEVQPDPAKRAGIVFDGLTYNSIGLAFRRAVRRAGIIGMRWHDLRHVAATDTSTATGGNAFLIGLLTRHRDPEQLRRYVNHGLGELAKALDAAASPAPVVSDPQGTRQDQGAAHPWG